MKTEVRRGCYVSDCDVRFENKNNVLLLLDVSGSSTMIVELNGAFPGSEDVTHA